MLGATRAEIALWVAIASAGISLTNLAWQLVLYRLLGARLIVRLIPAVITEAGHIIRGPARGWGKSIPEAMNIVGSRPWVDAAVVEFVNGGRAPISLSMINLDMGADPRWKPWRRHTVGMPPIAIHNGLVDIAEVRLEAGRSAFAIFDFWPAIDLGRKVRRRVSLRASVQPAGRRTKRSRWRNRWRIDPDQQHLWPHGPDGDRVKLFQAVWRAIAPLAPAKTYEAWLSVLTLLMPRDVDLKEIGILEVAQVLEPIVDGHMRAMLPAASILTALHKNGQAGAWMPDAGQEPRS